MAIAVKEDGGLQDVRHPFRMLVDGELCDGARHMEVINPATGLPFASAPLADARLVDRAVEAAAMAFPAWAARSRESRCECLMALADAVEKVAESLAVLLVAEQGKPLPHARYEIMLTAIALRTFAGMDLPETILRENDQERIVEVREPLGVVAAIIPWNLPVLLMAAKVAPALLTGNTMVIKPAPSTPLTTLRFGELCAEILPRGVVNIVTDANDLGSHLTAHPGVAKVAFTGSTATGRKVMASAAATIKRVTLELGGNDAAIMMRDADPASVARRLFDGAMINTGQVCLAIKRAYVPSDMYDEICDRLAAMADAAVVGDGMSPGVEFGPLQNAVQYKRVLDLIEEARVDGQIVAGGTAIAGGGYFIRPTIVRDIAETARLVREEQFGPILPVLSYKDEDDVVARVNTSEMGLSATIWGKDVERAAALARQLQVGTVWVNKHMDLPFDLPMRGAKQSGLGAEGGLAGLMEFTQAKVINIDLSSD